MAESLNPTEWITTGEAAELTGYTASYFRKAKKRGLLRGQELVRGWFLRREEVEAYAKEMRELGPDKHNPWRTQEHQKDDSAAPCLVGERYRLPAGRNRTTEEKTYVYRNCADSS